MYVPQSIREYKEAIKNNPHMGKVSSPSGDELRNTTTGELILKMDKNNKAWVAPEVMANMGYAERAVMVDKMDGEEFQNLIWYIRLSKSAESQSHTDGVESKVNIDVDAHVHNDVNVEIQEKLQEEQIMETTEIKEIIKQSTLKDLGISVEAEVQNIITSDKGYMKNAAPSIKMAIKEVGLDTFVQAITDAVEANDSCKAMIKIVARGNQTIQSLMGPIFTQAKSIAGEILNGTFVAPAPVTTEESHCAKLRVEAPAVEITEVTEMVGIKDIKDIIAESLELELEVEEAPKLIKRKVNFMSDEEIEQTHELIAQKVNTYSEKLLDEGINEDEVDAMITDYEYELEEQYFNAVVPVPTPAVEVEVPKKAKSSTSARVVKEPKAPKAPKVRKLTVNQQLVLDHISKVSTEELPEITGLNWRQIQACIGALYKRNLLCLNLTHTNVSPTSEQCLETLTGASRGTDRGTKEVIKAFHDELIIEAEETILDEVQVREDRLDVWEDVEYCLHGKKMPYSSEDSDTLKTIQDYCFNRTLEFEFKTCVVGSLAKRGISNTWDCSISSDAIHREQDKNTYLWDLLGERVRTSQHPNILELKELVHTSILNYLEEYYPNGWSSDDEEEFTLYEKAKDLASKLHWDAGRAMGKVTQQGIFQHMDEDFRKQYEEHFIDKAVDNLGLDLVRYKEIFKD